MQLISILDTTENDSANSKDVAMESLEHSVVGKETLESFLDIPSYADVNGAESCNGDAYTTNGEEPMEVDSLPDNQETQAANNIPEETKPEDTIVANGGDTIVPPIEIPKQSCDGESKILEEDESINECNAVPPIETRDLSPEEESKILEEDESMNEHPEEEVDNEENKNLEEHPEEEVRNDETVQNSEPIEDTKTEDNVEVNMDVDKDDMCSESEPNVLPADTTPDTDGLQETEKNIDSEVDCIAPKNDESDLVPESKPVDIINEPICTLENNELVSSQENVENINVDSKKSLSINVADLNSSDTSSVDINTEEILLKDDAESLTLNLSPNEDESALLNEGSEEPKQDASKETEEIQSKGDSKTMDVLESDPTIDNSEATNDLKVDSEDNHKSTRDTVDSNSKFEENNDLQSPKINDTEKTETSKDDTDTNTLEVNTIPCDESAITDIPENTKTDVVETPLNNLDSNVINDADKTKDVNDSASEHVSEISETPTETETQDSVVNDSVNKVCDDDDNSKIVDSLCSEDKNISTINECDVVVKGESDVSASDSTNVVSSISDEVKLETEDNDKVATLSEDKLDSVEPASEDKDVEAEKVVENNKDNKPEVQISEPMDVSNEEAISNNTDEKSSESVDKDDVEIVNKPSEPAVESMIVSDDDEDSVVTITKSDEVKEKEEKNETDKVVELDENKADKENTEADKLDKKETVSLSDDDDIVLVDEGSSKTADAKMPVELSTPTLPEVSAENKESESKAIDTDLTANEKPKPKLDIPICPLTIMKKLKPALDSMSREDLEEYIVVKIVESISGRSAISDLQLKLKSQEKSMEEWKKKVMVLSKQNKDLTIVLRNVCDEQQKRLKENPLPIKITRSVGLQVGYPSLRTPAPLPGIVTSLTPGNPIINNGYNNTIPKLAPKVVSPKPPAPQPVVNNPPVIPPPRRRGRISNSSTPAASPGPVTTPPVINSPPPSVPTPTPAPHITVRSRRSATLAAPKVVPSPPAPIPTPVIPTKVVPTIAPRSVLKNLQETPKAEKRSAVQSIDLTDDEPPPKIPALRTPPRPTPTIRAVNTNQLTNNTNKVTYVVNNSAGGGTRQVYIPINAQGQNVQANSMMVRGKVLNKVPIPNMRQLPPAIRIGAPIPIRPVGLQHPAPLPQSINSKAQMHPSWKWIPPRPTLKIARVENGIVISWEMNDFSESQHEPIASYQIFAYQEASTQPTTDLWKKIGDVKALPLPMACTLTHFMAGFKYFFAVRAIDIRTRVGPFSAPGQITLLNNKK